MSELDIKIIKDLIDTPETVNSDYSSEVIDISDRETAFAVQVNYDNGSSVNMELVLEVSNDDQFYFPLSTQTISDSSGGHLWDIGDTGAAFLRVSINVTSGSIDVNSILYKAKCRD